jgi:hypothetical protein
MIGEAGERVVLRIAEEFRLTIDRSECAGARKDQSRDERMPPSLKPRNRTRFA